MINMKPTINVDGQPVVVEDDDQSRRVEAIDESLAGIDFDRDGQLSVATEIRGVPTSWVGAAAGQEIDMWKYPVGTEFLHTVRYVDPDTGSLLSTRVKEVRYSRKTQWLDQWANGFAYESEEKDKEEGKVPDYSGTPMGGLESRWRWRLQGFIEDPNGRLRMQTMEETRFCMGCHSTIGVTVDQTFTLARKVPGSDGWAHQYATGIQDVPQYGHAEPEILTYFKRVRGGDEFRANEEILEKFFDAQGNVNEELVRRAAPGGPEDISFLLKPSRERTLDLNRAYMAIVRGDNLHLGRDTIIRPPQNVFTEIAGNGDTELADKGLIFTDGRLWLDWDWQE